MHTVCGPADELTGCKIHAKKTNVQKFGSLLHIQNQNGFAGLGTAGTDQPLRFAIIDRIDLRLTLPEKTWEELEAGSSPLCEAMLSNISLDV